VLVNRSLKESKLPKGVIVGAIVRDEEVIAPRGETVIGKNDSVILFSTYESIKQVEKMFSVRVDFF
jgi:trk system potassium uptake protein TrkA